MGAVPKPGVEGIVGASTAHRATVTTAFVWTLKTDEVADLVQVVKIRVLKAVFRQVAIRAARFPTVALICRLVWP